MAIDSNVLKEVVDALKQDPEIKNNVYQATVSKIDNEGVVWVNIAGSDMETPTAITSAEVEPGDAVNVEWRNNKLYIGGNYSNPSAGVVRVANVEQQAETARVAAESAVLDASRASEAADNAQASASAASTAATAAQTAAGNAQTAADTALVNLATTEDVVGVLNWITAHGTMTSQSGGTFVDGQVYFVQSAQGDYVVNGTHYAVVPEPVAADINSYYVLSIDESVQNYVATHVAVDSEGLWLIPEDNGTPASSSKKILIAVGGSGHTYSTAGTYIIEKVGGVDTVLASFTASGAQIGQTGQTRSEIDYHSMQLIDNDGDPYLHISDLREQNGTVTITDEWLGHGTKYDLSNIANSTNYEITVNGSVPHDLVEQTTEFFRFNNGYNQNDTVRAVYQTADQTAKGYTLGIRDTGNIGGMSFVSGANNIAEGMYSSATGYETHAYGKYSHTEGQETETDYTGYAAHAEGYQTYAEHQGCHAEGYQTKAEGSYSHAEGYKTDAMAPYSHAEGSECTVYLTGYYGHAEGGNTYVSGDYAHAQNYHTTAASDYQTVIGKHNVSDSSGTYALIIGNGTGAASLRSNALTVDWNGCTELGHGVSNTIASCAVKRTDTGVRTWVGVGTGGINHGLYSDENSRWIINDDDAGVTYIPSSDIRLKGHTTSIGSRLSGDGTASCANTTSITKIADLETLPAGSWIVTCSVRFPSNSTGTRGAQLMEGTSGRGVSYCAGGATGGQMAFCLVENFVSSSTIDLNLGARQNSGSSMTITYYWSAIRIA